MAIKPKKVALTIALALLGALLIAELAAHVVVSRQDHELIREGIAARTRAATGFDLEIRGGLELPYSLLPSIVFRDVALLNPRIPGGTLITAEELRLVVALLPLLRGEVRVYDSALSNVELILAVDADGDANWITGVPLRRSDDRGPVAIHALTLEDVRLRYDNANTGVSLSGGIDRLEARTPVVGGRSTLDVSAEFSGVPIEMSGEIGAARPFFATGALPFDLSGEIADVNVSFVGGLGKADEGNISDAPIRFDITADGDGLQDLEALLPWPLPETHTFEVNAKIAGGVTTAAISEIAAVAGWRDHDLTLSGSIADVREFSGLELIVAANGEDLSGLSHLYGLDWLPATDSYDISGVLAGDWPTLGVRDGEGKLVNNDLSLEFSGDIAELPDFRGIDVAAELRGVNVQDVPFLPDPELLPVTNEYDISGSIRGDWPAIGLFDAQSRFRRNNITASSSGAIGNVVEWSGLELATEIEGDDLGDLTPLIDLPPMRTQTFRLKGTVRGAWPALSVQDADARLTRVAVEMHVTGDLDSFVRPRLNVSVRSKGSDISAVPELDDFDLPATSAFEFEGVFRGALTAPALSGMTARFERGDQRITLTGDVGNVVAFDGIDWQVVAEGTDLSELNDVLAPDFPETESYRLTASLTGDADDLSANDLVLDASAPGIRASVRGSIGKIVEVRDLDVTGNIDADDLTALGAYLGPDLPEVTGAQIDGRLLGSAPDFEVRDVTVRTGETVLQGNGRLNVADRASIDGVLSSGVFDMRPFLVAAREDVKGAAEAADERLFSDQPFDFSYLDGFDARLTLDNLELLWTAGNVLVENATIELVNGTLTVDPLDFRRGDTRMGGRFSLERNGAPSFDTELTIENVNLETFLADIRIHDVYEGTFDLILELQAQGNSVREAMSVLDGNVAMFMSQARIPGVSLPLLFTDVLFGFLPWMNREENLVVDCAISRLVAESGVVDVQLLYLDSDQLRMLGGGTIDLRDESIDLRLAPRPRGTRLFAHNVDLLVRGTLLDPSVSSTGAMRSVATKYGMFAAFGPLGLLVPTSGSKRHPCVGSLQEYRQQQTEAE